MATSGGSGGNTTTAAAARKFYRSPELRERLVLLCPEEYQYTARDIFFHSKCYSNYKMKLILEKKYLEDTAF